MVKKTGLLSVGKVANLLVLLSSFLFISCEDVLSSHQKWEPPEISWNVNPRLNVDNNDYYHLTIDTTRWQTLHRFSGSIKYVSESSNSKKYHQKVIGLNGNHLIIGILVILYDILLKED